MNPLFFLSALLIVTTGLGAGWIFHLWRTSRRLAAELAESKKSESLLRTTIDTGILNVMHDITDLKRTEERLRKKDRLLQAVVKATYEIIHNNQMETAIGKGLALLGGEMQLDRVNIYNHTEEADGSSFIDLLACWDADSDTVEYRQPAMQHIPVEVMAFVLGVLGRNEMYARAVSELEDMVLRGLLERRKVKSLVALPIFVAERFWGFVSFNDCHRERDWTPTELSILQSFGVTLGVVIERKAGM